MENTIHWFCIGIGDNVFMRWLTRINALYCKKKKKNSLPSFCFELFLTKARSENEQ